ncbi:MAG: MFS transporter, partial [Candidatus Eisenbacteria bacterium]|nr:MFS transporter [Candidatus Latescibacterota bacterium]MBD3300943.1 MFS transporter [Candidatus Eisenbacteria bacterium]
LWVHMNLYFRTLGLGEATIGRILSAGSLGMVLISLPAAVWIDRFRAQRVFSLSAIAFALAMALQLTLTDPRLLLLASLATMVGFSVHWVAAAPFIMRNAAQSERTELFGVASALETLATVIAAFGAGFLASRLGTLLDSELLGLRYTLYAVAGLSFLASIPFAAIRSDPISLPGGGWRRYVVARDWKLLGKICLPIFLIGCGAGLTIPFLNLYFRNRFGQNPAEIGVYFAIAQTMTMIGFLVGPVLARRFTHVRAIVATQLFSIPFFLILAIADRLWVAVGAFWIRGALMNMNHPISSAFSMEIIPSDQQATTNSMRMLSWNLSWMCMTPLGGWLIERYGFSPNMIGTMGLYLIASVIFWRFFRGWTVEGGDPAKGGIGAGAIPPKATPDDA